MKTQDRIITESVILVLGFMIQSMVKTCFNIAFDNELSDLKGLVAPDSFCEMENGIGSIDVELDLLDILDDPSIKTYLNTIEKIHLYIDTYRLLNKLDDIDFGADDDVLWLAEQTFCLIINVDAKPCKVLDNDLNYQYNNYYMLIWIMAHQNIMQNRDVPGAVESEFYAALDMMLSGDLQVENKNANLLFSLAAYLHQDEIEWWNSTRSQ